MSPVESSFEEKELACAKLIMEKARELEMTPIEYRRACFNILSQGDLRPGFLVQKGLAQKLTIIFDIDHTLIHSYARGGIFKWPENTPHFEIAIGNSNSPYPFRPGVIFGRFREMRSA